MEEQLPQDDGRVVGGFNAVLAALESRGRSCRRLMLAEGRRPTPVLEEILTLAKSLGLSYKTAPRQLLDKAYGRREHQGVLAFFDPLEYADFDDFLDSIPREGRALVLVLDKVEDPRNLGALTRSAVALGALGLIIPRERAAALTGAALSASAGAAEKLPIARVVNLARAIKTLQDNGFWVVGAEGGAGENLLSFSFPERTALVLGSEGRGLSELISQKCDYLVSIPLAEGTVTSLNVSAAGSILMFEYLRQMGLER